MKPENYRFVSLKQDKQDQWAPLGVSSRSEFSVNTIMWCKGSSVGWETLVTTVEGRRKAQHLIGVEPFLPLMVVSSFTRGAIRQRTLLRLVIILVDSNRFGINLKKLTVLVLKSVGFTELSR